MSYKVEDRKRMMESYLSRVCGETVLGASDEDLRGFELLVLDLQHRFLGLNLSGVLWEALGEELP